MNSELAEQLAETAAAVVASGAISGHGHGNASIRVPNSPEMPVSTAPTLHGLTSAMVARIRLDTEILENEVPTINEAVMDMHTAIYADQPEAGCVIHTTGFGSDQYNELTDASHNEPDLAKRKLAFSDFYDLFLDECFVMPLAPQPVDIVARTNLQNVKWRINRAPMFSEIWLR
jgi:hypothetical protein